MAFGKMYFLFIIYLTSITTSINVSGPGLKPDKIVMPARYFFVNITSIQENSYYPELSNELAVEIKGESAKQGKCRIWLNKLDRKDGTFIIRYKVYETCYDLVINIYYKNQHIKGSPIELKGTVQPDLCYCPEKDFQLWQKEYGCPNFYEQIKDDLRELKNIDMQLQVDKIIKKYNQPESTSFCHYIIKDNQVYRECYGKHVGFNMFADNILLALTRKVIMPDLELVINLGDWPLVKKKTDKLAVFSWCGSNDTLDIVMPTYDITESTLENMGRVTLDMLSVQGEVERDWSHRESKAFWRGRDSRYERLKLVDIARANPELFNVSLTNFFFYRDKEKQYGPKEPHISFYKFFDYKYQINIDGTVAAYRYPYLLGGGGMVLKQESPYYEHFYKKLRAWEHYVPIKRDLSDLKDRVEWARDHDNDAKEIAKNARIFANENLLPQHIICYHAVLLSEWSKRLVSEVKIRKTMTHVSQPSFECDCQQEQSYKHGEL